MSLRKRTKKLSKSMVTKLTGTKWLTCKECGEEELLVAMDVVRVTCGMCVQRTIAPPDNYIKKEKSDKPRGWHFMAYYEHDGKVYSKGEEVTDPKLIASLKKTHGKTKKPTSKKLAKTRGKKNARTPR